MPDNDLVNLMMGKDHGPNPSMGSPLSTPQEAKGDIASGKISVQMAIKLLQQSFSKFEHESPEADAVLKSIESLSKVFGSSESETNRLIPAEMVSLLQANGASPEQMAMQNAQTQGAPQGAPQGSPQGAPPGGMPGMMQGA